uniref:Uncharacterized protein n=1 Tax=Anguilla anguilla TaxID=7936 RepID=A0A0E9RG65_ANGAN
MYVLMYNPHVHACTPKGAHTHSNPYSCTLMHNIYTLSLSLVFLFSMFSHSHIPADLVLANVYHPFLNQQAQM